MHSTQLLLAPKPACCWECCADAAVCFVRGRPAGWRTQDVGATGLAFCLAPPGYELVDGSAAISKCPIGAYKEGWNRNPCLPVSCRAAELFVGRALRQHAVVPPLLTPPCWCFCCLAVWRRPHH